jgi:putative Ca2+/H+ antiporter (TMEM165/GDT1 family)
MNAGFVEVVTIALVAQLLVLPGEKVQFIISGLSTRYNPLVVVAAAASAFAGWTAVEIWFGQAVKGALPPIVLDVITAGLFLTFAVLLYRSAPKSTDPGVEPDGGNPSVEDYEFPLIGTLPNRFGSFLPIFAMMAAGEFGDKTQLITISLAIQYGAHPGIWVGEMLAIIPVSLANAYFFHTFATSFDARKAHFAGAGLFAFFGLDTVLSILTGVSVWEWLVGVLSTIVLDVLGPYLPNVPVVL